jgi:hypothetical protein
MDAAGCAMHGAAMQNTRRAAAVFRPKPGLLLAMMTLRSC